MDYLVYVAVLGAGAVFFLWARDARIFYRTGLQGFRRASYQGVWFGAVAILGVAITAAGLDLLGLGLILLALYLQGRVKREKVFSGNEPVIERVLGRAVVKKGTSAKKTDSSKESDASETKGDTRLPSR